MDTTKTPGKVTTYARRGRRNRTSNEEDESQSDSSIGSHATPSVRSLPRRAAAARGTTPGKTATKASPKSASKPKYAMPPPRIDLREATSATPRRGRSHSKVTEESEGTAMRASSRRGTPGHARSKSTVSVKSLSQNKSMEDAAPRTRARSRSRARSVPRGADEASVISAKPRSKGNSVWDDEDDGSVADSLAESVAGTSAGGKISRTAKDRQEYFKNQSDCHAFGPHRAICSRCKQVVNLTRKQTYAVGPWERHRSKCDEELASDAPLPPDAEKLVNAPVEEIFGEQPVRRNAAERRAYLMADKYVATVEEERVECGNCKKWVMLKKGQPYDLAKWKLHRDRCISDSTEDAAAIERKAKLAIVNDPLVKSFDGQTIECSRCSGKVIGSFGQDYNLTAWEEHKSQCRDDSQKPPEGTNSVPFPLAAAGKPLSKASTEGTLVAGPDAARQGAQTTKRPRDEEPEDERPPNRQKVEPTTETPASDESPGILGWFMLPFHSFARGFRESLKGGASASS